MRKLLLICLLAAMGLKGVEPVLDVASTFAGSLLRIGLMLLPMTLIVSLISRGPPWSRAFPANLLAIILLAIPTLASG